ncbi:unnamed protein product, partial [Laminaria digitata]
MRRSRCITTGALLALSSAAVAVAFQVQLLPDTSRHPFSCHFTHHPATRSPVLPHQNTQIGHARASSACSDRRFTGHGDGGRFSGVVMMARANRQKAVEQRQKKLAKNAAPVVLSAKARRQANRARRAFYREKFACSGHRLIKLQEEDDSSFYIGFVGTNRAGRAQALKSVEAFLKKATEMKARVAKYYKGDANIKLVDAGNLRMSEMAGKSEHKLGLLRRCDLLVQVVRCFDLYAPKVSASRVTDEDESSDAAEEDVLVSMYLGAGQGEGFEESDIDWPLASTPLEDIRSARADMAYADLQFIEERQKTNHTKWFWRDQRRAYNEQTALGLVVPVLEDAYAVGGELKPFGPGFRESCLRDEPREDGTMLYRSRLRAAVREIGFLSPKPVVYVANVPPEAVPSENSEETEGETPPEASESVAAIARVALAHADRVADLRREFRVPAVTACLRDREGQETLGAVV